MQRNRFSYAWKVFLAVSLISAFNLLLVRFHDFAFLVWGAAALAFGFMSYVTGHYSRKIDERTMTESQVLDEIFERLVGGK